MLVLLRSLGEEGQMIVSLVVPVIGNDAVHRPEIRMHVEEIHEYGNLYAFGIEVFLLESLPDYHNFTVSNCRNNPVVIVPAPFRKPVEPEGESHEDQYQGTDYGQHDTVGDEVYRKKQGKKRKRPSLRNRTEAIFVYSHIKRMDVCPFRTCETSATNI